MAKARKTAGKGPRPASRTRKSGTRATKTRGRGGHRAAGIWAAGLVALALGLTLAISLLKSSPPAIPEPEPRPPLAIAPEPGPAHNPDLSAPDFDALAREAGNLGIAGTRGQEKPRTTGVKLSVQPGPERLRPQRPKAGPRLILVIDDAGHNLEQLEPFLKLPFPVTIAVLPGLAYSRQAAEAALAAGKEVILHQPMEALGGQDPGPGAISLGMAPAEASAIVRANLDSLPGVKGMNNHEGSAVSRDEALMGAIMGVAKKRGIYYLDSLTVSDTAARAVASREGILHWERDVFLDNSPDRVSIIHYLDVGKRKAEKNGAAVMIGHVWSANLAQTLTELYPGLIAEGFSLSTISKVMLEEADASSGD